TVSESSTENTEKLKEKIKELEHGILESKSNYNNFVILLECTEHKSPKVIHAAIHALYRSFLPLLARGELQKPKGPTGNDDKVTIVIWLRENYIRYVNKLCSLLRHEEPGLQVPSLNILLELLKVESSYLSTSSGVHHFSNNHFYRVVEGLIDNENFSEQLKTEFVKKYFNIYDDLRFYFLKDASKIINLAMDSGKPKDKSGPISKKKRTEEIPDVRLNNLMENTFAILEKLQTMPT
ncbi:2673_t:CDS:2, partial [Acaulospora morrowiae]